MEPKNDSDTKSTDPSGKITLEVPRKAKASKTEMVSGATLPEKKELAYPKPVSATTAYAKVDSGTVQELQAKWAEEGTEKQWIGRVECAKASKHLDVLFNEITNSSDEELTDAVVEALVKAGWEINRPSHNYTADNDTPVTPIEKVCRFRMRNAVACLLRNKADPNAYVHKTGLENVIIGFQGSKPTDELENAEDIVEKLIIAGAVPLLEHGADSALHFMYMRGLFWGNPCLATLYSELAT